MKHKGITIEKFAAGGSPQGGIFSPWIFNTLADILHKKWNEIPGIISHGFADDSVIQAADDDLGLLYIPYAVSSQCM